MLRIEALAKRFGTTVAVDDVTLQIPPGQMVGVIGRSGAGSIGQELYYVIRQFIYVDISAIVLLLILTVALIDLACDRVRRSMIGEEAFTA